MLKRGIVNSDLMRELALMGAADQIIISSASFPKIDGVKVIDISLVDGVPTIEQVVSAIKDEIEIDMITLSDEVKESNPDFVEYLSEVSEDITIDYQSYRQVKIIAKNAVAIFRTGDSSLYKTVIIRSQK